MNSMEEPPNCDPADPACEPPNCDPADPACEPPNCDPADPACEPPNCDPADPFCGGSPPEEDNCNDGIDNDGDGFIDSQDGDCGPGGAPPITSPGNQLSRGGNDNNDENGVNAEALNGETDNSFLPEAIAQLIQVAEGQIDGEIYYILIENVNNETKFVPDDVTLPLGYTVVWINNDSSRDHRVVVSNENGKSLLNSVVSYNSFISYKFESEGQFLYSDFENTESNGLVMVVLEEEDNVEISGPLPGIETIISSLGFN
jgi:plastocyanin